MFDSPNPNSTNSYLEGVAPLSSSDVWAVGYYVEGAFKTLAMHWNGSVWTITSTPNPSSSTNLLKKVVAISTNDVWSVGGHGQSYTLHWNGGAWTEIPLPPINNRGFTNVTNFLEDIAAVSSNDIWMVGSMDASNGGTWTLTMHWNGTQWTQVPSPNVAMPSGGTYSQGFDSVVALAPNNVWAVGYYRVGNTEHTLIEHWDGAQWSIVPSPDGPTGDGWLHGIAASGPNDIWAVGEDNKVDFNSDARALALHWNGATWSAFVPPNPSPFGINPLKSVVARGANDFYAVGSWEADGQGLHTFVVHWDGTNWTQDSSENPPGSGSGWNPLLDVGRDSSGNLWAVGKKQDNFGSPNYTLVERRNFAPASLAMTSVVSRKVHGNAGTFDIELPTDGSIATECRMPTNGEYTLVYSFTTELTGVDGVTLSGTANVAGREIGPNQNQYTVHLTNVADLQHLTVQLDGVHGLGGASVVAAPAQMDVVIGDTNKSRAVNTADVAQVKAQTSSPVTGANFRADITANGAINAADISAVKARSGGGL